MALDGRGGEDGRRNFGDLWPALGGPVVDFPAAAVEEVLSLAGFKELFDLVLGGFEVDAFGEGVLADEPEEEFGIDGLRADAEAIDVVLMAAST